MELFSISDVLQGGQIDSIIRMKFKKRGSDDVYSFTKDGQLQINTLVPKTETYRLLGVVKRTRVKMVPGVKLQLISNISVEEFHDFYPKYAAPWIKFTSVSQLFTVYRPKTIRPLNVDDNEKQWLKIVKIFGEDIKRIVNKTSVNKTLRF